MNTISIAEENQRRTAIHQVRELTASPQQVYECLTNSAKFAFMTGLPAKIDSFEGGTVSLFGGYITGRNVELIPNQRVVQSWRPKSWGPGIYSTVKFELMRSDEGTTAVLDHTGFPEGNYDHLFQGWDTNYWTPLSRL
jgi:activator of HSP90 ATPase